MDGSEPRNPPLTFWVALTAFIRLDVRSQWDSKRQFDGPGTRSNTKLLYITIPSEYQPTNQHYSARDWGIGVWGHFGVLPDVDDGAIGIPLAWLAGIRGVSNSHS